MNAPKTTSAPASAPAYSPGLDGVIAGETAICCVDVDAGLLYRGYDIHDLATCAEFEQIVFLLIHGEMPNETELAELRTMLTAESHLPDAVLSAMRLMPAGAHPIDTLRTMISMLASFDPELNDHSHAANVRKSIRLIARTATVITSAARIARGQQPLPPKPGMSHAARLLHGLGGQVPDAQMVRAMDTVLTLYAEHDFNASAFAARVTASTLSDIYAAITSAIGALKGPLHGGANEEAMTMLRQVASPERAEAWVSQRLARHEKIMGFGHRIYKKGDSRVPAMRDLAAELGRRFGQPQWVEICQALEEAMRRQKNLYSNLDLYAAPVLHLMGLGAELNISIFAAARVSGWCAHVIEQHDHNRIIRPKSLYVGPARRAWK